MELTPEIPFWDIFYICVDLHLEIKNKVESKINHLKYIEMYKTDIPPS